MDDHFRYLIDEQMGNWVGVEHQPDVVFHQFCSLTFRSGSQEEHIRWKDLYL